MEKEEIIIKNDDCVSELLPENVREFREKLKNYNAPKLDMYGEGLAAQAYLEARSSPTGTYSSIRKALKLDKLTFQYYMNKYPDFVAAVKMGIIDGRQERLNDLEGTLLARALGVEIEEERVEESGAVDEDGNLKGMFRKVVRTKKQIPPDASAALEILRKIDPSWNPKSSIDVNFVDRMNVTEDININVDLRTLSPAALREILESNKQPVNTEINKTPGGESVRFLHETPEKAAKRKEKRNEKAKEERTKKKKKKDPNVKRKTRVMSPETRAKISEAMKKRHREKREGKI